MIKIQFDITTSAGGAYDSTNGGAPQRKNLQSRGPVLLYAVEWVDGTLDNGVDAVLSMTETASGVDKTLLTLTNADDDAWYWPRELADDTAGAALTGEYAMQVVEGTLKLVVSSGGNAKTGKCICYFIEV